MKLNLGCGDKLYPTEDGWINVDIVLAVPEEKVELVGKIHKDTKIEGNKPLFHNAELKDLHQIDSGIVDEIHGYHIIEHFYRDEVQGVLEEWLRVLKPQGKIFLEQPDITKCAANFLAGILNGDERLAYNLGYLGFYGDGTSKEPYMGHHWGWYPLTLGKAMEEAGYVNIQQEPAQTHMKDRRDFRMTGRKPLA
jgi:hypothetical protein